MELKEAAPESVEVSGQKSVSLLSDEELNIAVAKVCGWETIEHWGPHPIAKARRTPYITGTAPFQPIMDDRQVRMELPDYCHDLDAMHEAEKTLPTKDWDEIGHSSQGRYRLHLGGLVGETLWNATARQRAEAFVLTMAGSADSVSDLTKSDSASVKPEENEGHPGDPSAYGDSN